MLTVLTAVLLHAVTEKKPHSPIHMGCSGHKKKSVMITVAFLLMGMELEFALKSCISLSTR